MSRILKKTKKDTKSSTGDKFFGAFMPGEIHEFIALYTEAHGITKTDVLREMANEWLKKTMDESSINDLTIGLYTKINKQIDSLKTTRHYNLSEIKSGLRKELIGKGISTEIVTHILSNIKR